MSDGRATGLPTVLLVLDALPLPLTEGDRMRSYYLAQAIGAEGRCVLATLSSNDEHLKTLQTQGPFDEIVLLPERLPQGHPRRLLRTSNSAYLTLGWPQWVAECQRRLTDVIARERVTTVVAGKLPVAELVAPLPVAHRVLDDFDCYTLTLEREYALHHRRMSVAQRLHHRIAQHRYRSQESDLSEHFQLVTTISPVDGARLRQLDGNVRIEVVPNGISPALIEATPVPGPAIEGMAFWGNLAFEPNRSAVEWFIEEVYGPRLASSGLPCYLIGGGADPWIAGLPQRFANVHVTGFVDDLWALVSRIPIMINPMVSGSGLKNKMLEAMALGRAIVSTSMGSEALDVRPDTHYRCADAPDTFANAIMDLHHNQHEASALGSRARQRVAEQYTWPRVQARWREVLAVPGAMDR